MRRSLRCLLLVLCSGIPAQEIAAQAPSSVQDLQYGEVLFHFYQQDYFNSIVRLQIAQQQERLPHHAEQAELLLGGLNLSYGLRAAADAIFQRLLDSKHITAAVRNRAWYYLAKISWQRGDTLRALEALARLGGEMSPATRGDAANLQSLALLQLGRNAEAVRLLQAVNTGADWSPYLAYNLGVAQIRSNDLETGSRELERLGELQARNEALRLLRDRANLALGYSYLRRGEAERSRQALERVRLEGPLSNKALLGTGWADSELEAYGRALVPWTELETRRATDPAVQEALLAIPYAMTRLDLHGRAVQHYQRAIDTLRSEQHLLDEAIAAVRNGELVTALEEVPPASGSGWLQKLDVLSGSPALRYQVELMAAHDFQEALKNYRDLQALQDNLERWADSIAAYDDMLDGRETRFAVHRPAAVAALETSPVGELEARRDRLATTLARSETTEDPFTLASGEELGQWRRLESIRTRLGGLPATGDVDALVQKQRLLQGMLYWQMAEDYKPRLWQAKQQLAEVDTHLVAAHQARERLREAGLDTPVGFEKLAQRIASYKQRLLDLQARTLQVRLAQGAYLDHLAVEELERQKQRVATYLVQARFAMAQTHDRALNAPHTGEGSDIP